MKLTEFIQWVGGNPDQVVKDSGGVIRNDCSGFMAFYALRDRDRLTGETERVAGSVRIPRHSKNADEFFEPGFFADIIGIEKIYKLENAEFSFFLWKAAEKQNTELIALAFEEISPDKITELIWRHGCVVDPFVGYWKYAKAFEVIGLIRGKGLSDTHKTIMELLRNSELYTDCAFCNRWVGVAIKEWSCGNKWSAESIIFNIRRYIFEAAQRKCFKNRELIPAAKETLYTLGINYEPRFCV